MISLVYLCKSAPSKFAADLELAGFIVHEALAVSEVLYLCEHERIDAVVIAPDVEDHELIEVQLRHITMKLKTNATVADVVWEARNLFPRQQGVNSMTCLRKSPLDRVDACKTCSN